MNTPLVEQSRTLFARCIETNKFKCNLVTEIALRTGGLDTGRTNTVSTRPPGMTDKESVRDISLGRAPCLKK